MYKKAFKKEKVKKDVKSDMNDDEQKEYLQGKQQEVEAAIINLAAIANQYKLRPSPIF